MKEVRQIKQLNSALSNMLADAEVMKIEIANKQKEYTQKLKAIESIKEQIAKLEFDGNAKVSEHAIIRYLERVKGLNIEEIEKEILSEKILSLIEKLGGNGTYPADGYSVIMKNYTVITVK